jgi:hypothetical protein
VAMEASYRSHLTFILGHLKDFQNFISQWLHDKLHGLTKPLQNPGVNTL